MAQNRLEKHQVNNIHACGGKRTIIQVVIIKKIILSLSKFNKRLSRKKTKSNKKSSCLYIFNMTRKINLLAQ